MRKREFLKRCLSLCLSSAMVVGMLPAMSADAAEASGYYLTDAQGQARESVRKVASDNHEIIDINMKDGKTHKVTIYLLDEDNSGRWSMVDVIDPDTQKLLDSQNIYDFSKGVYLSWNISGHMQIRLTNVWTKRYQKSKDTAIHGIFIDGKDARADGSAVVTTEEPEEDKAANSFESINVLGRYAQAGEKFTLPFDKQVQSVELRFNGNIDPSSENLDKVKVIKDGQPVKGEVRSSFNSVTFVPEVTMKDGKYTVQIPADLKNSAGQTLGEAATAEFEVQAKVEVIYFRDGMNYMARRVELAFNDRLAYTGTWDDDFADLPEGVLAYQDGEKRELKLWKSGNHGGLLYEIDDEESILPSGTYKFTLPAGIKSVSGAVSAEPYEKEFTFNSSQLSAKIDAPLTVQSGNAFTLDVKECIGYGELRYAFSEEDLKNAAYEPVKESITVTPMDGITGKRDFYVQFRVKGGDKKGTESPKLHKKMRIGDVTEGEKYPFDMQGAGAYDKDGFGSDRNPMDGVFDQSTNVWSASTSNYIADGEDGLSDKYDEDKDSVITTEQGIEYHLSKNIYRDGYPNVATGNGKEIPVPKETKYERIYVLAAGKNDDNVGTFTMNYKDGTSTTQDIDAHYWANAYAHPENVVFEGISACYGWSNNRIFPDGVMRQYELLPDDDKVLTSVVLPKTSNLIRVFAMTGKEINTVVADGQPVMAKNIKSTDVVSCLQGKADVTPEESDPTYDEFMENYGADAELRGAADVTDVTNIQEVPAGERQYDENILKEKEEETGGYGQGLYPYVRQPEKLMSYKIRMQASEDYELDIEDALEAIRRVDNLSRGLDKKCYLVGWQTNGHDTGFPYFGEVNPRHKRPMDETALESLKWLIQEAKKYHTTITLHVNFSDAYTDDDPISQEMVEKQIPIREKNGEIRHTGRWARHVGFITSAYANYFTGNWQEKQIDPLVKMLPELEGQSVHPDAWYSWEDPYYDLDVYDMTDAQRRHAIYMREKYNMDLTTEFDFQFGVYNQDKEKPIDHVLYFPMIWQSGWSETNPMRVPSYFQSAVNQTTWDGRYLSAAGRYFGEGSAVEPNLWDYWDGEKWKKDGDIYMYGLKQSFAEKELTRQYLNTLLRASMDDNPSTGGEAVLYAGDGQKVSSAWKGDNTVTYKRTVKVGDDVVLQEPGNVFMPMTWRPGLEIQAWSKAGYKDKSWKLPMEWKDVQKVDMYDLSLEGLRFVESIDVKDRAIQMSMDADQTAVVVPAGSNPNSTQGFAQNGSVQFVGRDTQTGANWTKLYGKEGYDIFEKETHIPAAVEINYVNAQKKQIQTGYKPEDPGTDKPVSEKIDIAKANITAIPAQKFTGKALTPGLSVSFDGKTLVKGSDYTVSYSNNTNIGTAKAIVTGIGKYTGSAVKTFTITVKKNAVYTVGNYKYKITNAKTDGKGTVSLTGVKSKDQKKKLKKISVGATVKIGGKKFNVTEIGSKAFADCKKVTSATVGANVTKIGASAFSNCTKLKTITISSKKLKSVGKNAFKNISAKAKIKVPKAKKKAYTKILKSKGQKKSVKVTS